MPRSRSTKTEKEALPEIRFLFRFRDLIAQTLERHREIIEEKVPRPISPGTRQAPPPAADRRYALG